MHQIDYIPDHNTTIAFRAEPQQTGRHDAFTQFLETSARYLNLSDTAIASVKQQMDKSVETKRALQ